MSHSEQIENDAETLLSVIKSCPSELRAHLYSVLAVKLRAACLNFQATHFEILTLSEERGKQPTFFA